MNPIPESSNEVEKSEGPILYRPKPKKLYIIHTINKDKNSFKKHFPLSPTSNSNFNLKNMKNENHIKKRKEKKNSKFDINKISLEEIETDFNLLKARSEVIEVENELLSLLRNSTKDNSMDEDTKDTIKIKRPKNPFLQNLE
jgi:hypothetical protein